MIEGSLAVVGGLQPSPTVAIGEIIHQVARAGRRPPRNGSSGRPFLDFRPEGVALIEDRQVQLFAWAEPNHMFGVIGDIVASVGVCENRQLTAIEG